MLERKHFPHKIHYNDILQIFDGICEENVKDR